MSGRFQVTVSEARGFVAVDAEIDKLAVVMGCASGGAVTSGLSPFYLSGQAAQTGVGYGDGPDALCQVIEQVQPSPATKVPAAMYIVPNTTVGSYGTIDVTGVTGTAVATVHSATKPYGTYEAYLRVTTGGFVGTSGIEYVWSLDYGRNVSRTVALGTATSITIPNSGVQFDLSPATADLTALDTLINEIYTDFNAHVILIAGGVHGAADNVDVVSIAAASDTATRIARINALRAAYILHIAKTAGGVHGSADATNVIVAPIATDDSSALILALDFKAKYNAHIIDVTAAIHGLADSTNGTTAPAPTAGALAAGDVIRCRTFAPAPTSSDLDTAHAALAASSTDFGLLVYEFPLTAALAAHVTTGLALLRGAGKNVTAICRTRIPAFETSETDATWAGLIETDFKNFNDSSVHVSAAYGLLTDAMSGRQYMRADLAQYAADVVRVGRSEFPNVPADRQEANFTLINSDAATIGHDEGPRGAVTGLSDDTQGNRFRSVMRLADSARRENVYSTVPWVMYASDERIRNLPTRRVANAMERVAVSAGTAGLGGRLFYIPANPNVPNSLPRLTAASRNAIQASIFSPLSREFKDDIQNANDGAIDSGLVQVNPVVTVTGGNLLTISVTLAPRVFGYLLNLNITLAVQE